MNRRIVYYFSFVLLLLTLLNCTDKFDITEVDTSGDGNINDTVYIKLSPDWEGFNKPQDVMVGREPFIYVADTENDRVVMLNTAGQFLGSVNIQHPTKLAQDYRLNLIVCGELTDSASGNIFSAVFKLDLYGAGHQIAEAKIDTILPKSPFDFLRPDREFTSAAVFFDNSYFIGRKGPVNSNPVDPDNAILAYIVKKLDDGTRKDTLLGKVPGLEPVGSGLLSASDISSITSFNNDTYDIIISLTGENSFKVQWLTYIQSSDFTGYQNRLPEFASDMMLPERFAKPMDVTVDPSNNIFVVDAEKDSLLKFNSFGDERESFGGAEVFSSPSGVAYFNKTLYIADTGNNRIVRFVLSTDL